MSTTISALANETLCEIFQHLFHSHTVNQWYKQTLPSIRLVSRHWNDIIETVPMLWTSILITGKSAFHSGQFPFHSTRLRLFRSLQLPLKIYIKLQSLAEKSCFNNSDAIILGEMIRALAPRITSIEMMVNSHSRTIQMIIVSSLNNTPVPLLRSFIHIDPKPELELDDGGYFQNPSSILQYQGTPETRRVITGWGSNLYPSLLDLNIAGVLYNLEHLPIMHGLRRLRIAAQPLNKRPSINQMLDILSPARHTLVVLQLEDVIKRSPTDTGHRSKPIIFKKLKVFLFGYYDSYLAQMFLESVRVPALVNLNLTCTMTPYPNRGIRIPDILIKRFPLHQIQRLTLNNAMFPPEGRYDMGISPLAGEEMSEADREAFEDMLQFRGFVQTSGHWRMPFFMYFLCKFPSLTHLHLDETIGLKKMMGAYWRPGTLRRLETLNLDGCPDGLFELAQAMEDIRKEGNRPLPLRISISEKLKSMLSEEEKARLDGHFEGLAGLYMGPKPMPVLSQAWDCRLSLLLN